MSDIDVFDLEQAKSDAVEAEKIGAALHKLWRGPDANRVLAAGFIIGGKFHAYPVDSPKD